MTPLLERITTPAQVAAMWPALTAEERAALQVRADWRGQLLLSVNERTYSASLTLSEALVHTDAGGVETTVDTRTRQVPVSKSLVESIFAAAATDAAFQTALVEFFGKIPNMDLIEN
jgi:hypothetical protein